MKIFILLIIHLYWILIPSKKRRKCIFKKTCSSYVFETTQQDGFISGLKAFKFRYKNCRSGITIFRHPVDDSIQVILPSGHFIKSEEIAERIIHNLNL